MARIGMIISTVEPNNHITGNTQRITTNVVAGWCGGDLVERVTFDLNTAGTLTIDVEGCKYKLRGVSKSKLYETLRFFLTLPKQQMNAQAVK